MKAKLYLTGEVAYILRQALGPLREWSDCLADMRREKTSIFGFCLLPLGRIYDGKALRPAYDTASISDFVRNIRLLCSEIETNTPPRGFHVDIDLSDKRDWKKRELTVMH